MGYAKRAIAAAPRTPKPTPKPVLRSASRAAARHRVTVSRSRYDPAFALLQTSIDEALACLGMQHPVDTRVHTARKALKKARAALRLLRPGLPPAVYARENIALRDAARYLSPLRDAKSLAAAVDLLGAPRDRAGLKAATLASLRQTLEQQLGVAWRRFTRGVAQRRCTDFVQSCRERMRVQEPQQADAAVLLGGLRSIYRKARSALAQATAKRTPAALHEWRKQTKYLHTAAATLQKAGAGNLRKLVERTDDIAAWLGDDHDLAVLREEIVRIGMQDEAVFARIEKQRMKLQGRALACGAQTLRMEPKQFAARLTAPRAWRAGGAKTSRHKRPPTAKPVPRGSRTVMF